MPRRRHRPPFIVSVAAALVLIVATMGPASAATPVQDGPDLGQPYRTPTTISQVGVGFILGAPVVLAGSGGSDALAVVAVSMYATGLVAAPVGSLVAAGVLRDHEIGAPRWAGYTAAVSGGIAVVALGTGLAMRSPYAGLGLAILSVPFAVADLALSIVQLVQNGHALRPSHDVALVPIAIDEGVGVAVVTPW